MTDKARKRGSVILLVVGLLTILAMLGSTLLLVSRLDRQTSQALASATPMNHVAEAVLAQLIENRAKDLHIDPNTGVIYSPDPNDPNNWIKTERYSIDYDYIDLNDPNTRDDYDRALASIEPNANTTPPTWRQISYLPGVDGNVHNVDPNTEPNMVDTDGDGINDAKLFRTDATDRDGNPFYAAVRMIDASGLVNVNYAYQTAPAAAGTVMDMANIEANDFFIATGGTFTTFTSLNLRPGRLPGNFDFSDFLAMADGNQLSWSGRLSTCWNAPFPDRRLLTTISKSRIDIPPRSATVNIHTKVNLNTASIDNLRNAFEDMLRSQGHAIPDDMAAQMAVNVWDYLHNPTDPPWAYKPSDPNYTKIYYGIKPQPFITETFIYYDPGNNQQYSALELYNPYKFTLPISSAGYKIWVGGTSASLVTANIPAGGRLVIRSDNVVLYATGGIVENIAGLDLRNNVKISRSASDGNDVAVDENLSITLPPDPNDPNNPVWSAFFRCDDPNRGIYSQPDCNATSPALDPNYDYTRTTSLKNLGAANPTSLINTISGGVPLPIYARGGNFINAGELNRIYYIGPDTTSSIPYKFSGAILGTGKFPFSQIETSSIWPKIPLGYLAADYFTVNTPDPNDPNNILRGQININTAPPAVLRYLPGIAQLSSTDRDNAVKEIIAYRDKLAIPGGHDYKTTPRAVITTINNQRENYGFASPGEIGIPIRAILTAPAIPDNLFTAPGHNYMVGINGTNDGLLNDTLNDLTKFHVAYAWLSNQVTVRSDTYIVYIRVQADDNPASTNYRRYVAVIDRSNCNTSTGRPKVLLFAEMK